MKIFRFTVVDSTFCEWRQIYTQKHNQKIYQNETSPYEREARRRMDVRLPRTAKLSDAFRTQIFGGRRD